MIIVYGGVQADGPDTAPPRLPESQVPYLTTRLQRLLGEWAPRLVVGAAASGADLLVLEAARAQRIGVRVLLPFPVEQFRRSSVASRGPAWAQRYDRLVSELRGPELETRNEPEDDGVYHRINGQLLDRAAQLAEPDEQVVTLLVRPTGTGGGSVTDDLGLRAEGRGWLVLDIDSLQSEQRQPRAFVAMPYGVKTDPETRRSVDCDQVFAQVLVPALEDADFRWSRSDREIDAGVVHVGMLEALANAQLVVFDTATLNPNVFYELGLRHALADKVTLLVGPRRQSRPFDISMIRRIPYDYEGPDLLEAEAVQALRDLRPFLEKARERSVAVDSPLFDWFPVEPRILTSRIVINRRQQTEVRVREQVQQAVDRGDVRAMVKAQQEVVEADLPQEVRLALRLQLAVGLLQQEEHELALAEFSQLEFEPGSPRHDRWVQQYALALRRQGERALQQDGDPDDAWDRAKAILGSALQAKTSAETCGIAAGLAKRQFQRFLDRGQPVVALAHLNDAVDLYRRGFDSDPLDYYTGVNLVSLLRLRGQHFRGDDPDLRDVAELLPVVRFHAGRAARSNLDFWPAVTVAELVLDELLLSPHAQDAAPAVIAYVQALARRPSPDSWRSSRSQLEMFLKAGDPGDLIKPVCAVFDAST